MFYNANMTQTITYWAPSINDGFGKVLFDPPILLFARWQDKLDLIRGAQGQEIPSSAVVYSETPLQPKGYVALGDFIDDYADPTEFVAAKQVISVGQSPSLDGTIVLCKAWL
jgi:hypothetical protein